MPDSLTHAFFALDVANKSDIKLENNKELYVVGAQGPDPFFYYKLFPWQRSNGVPKVGNMLHVKETQKFLLTYIKNLKDNYSKEAHIFLLGWICHYSLDSTAHPYIFHVTGNFIKNDKNTYKYRGNHLQLERSIDSIFLRNRGYNSNKYKATKEMFTLKKLPQNVKKILNKTIKSTYNLDNMGNEYSLSYKYFRKSHNLLCYDPIGVKKSIYNFFDRFNKKSKFVFKTFSYYDNVDPKVDYLNEKRREWIHPTCEDETSNASFMDLYNEAIDKAVYIIKEVDNYLNNTRNELTSVIKDITYDTGKDCSLNEEMKYFNAIL